MKFNVHFWNGRQWKFVAAVEAVNEQAAAKVVSLSHGLTGKFASYPHIDGYYSDRALNTPITEVY